MFYAIRHFTRYRYSRPVWQSVMEVRMHPRSENAQRCFTFQLSVSPRARIFSYVGHLGNVVHHFDLPEPHQQLTIIADSLVEVDEPAPLPRCLGEGAWEQLARDIEADDYWDMLMPSPYVNVSPAVEQAARDLGVDRRNEDPLSMVLKLNGALHEYLQYDTASTKVDTTIEEVLQSRRGVCQDYAHVMIALLRSLRIPSRYVSGYVCNLQDQSDLTNDMASHAWVDAYLPGLGWVGFDPTHNTTVTGRHIRTAVGRDYSDVPPALGTMKGDAETQLQVRVRVRPSLAMLPPDEELASDEEWSKFLALDRAAQSQQAQEQQQQQQQQ